MFAMCVTACRIGVFTCNTSAKLMDIAFGSGLAVVISVFTALLGLKKMVDIIGKIGPIIVGFSIILGIISAFWTYPHIPEGCELIQSGAIEVPHAGHSVLLSALAYTGTCTLLPMVMDRK